MSVDLMNWQNAQNRLVTTRGMLALACSDGSSEAVLHSLRESVEKAALGLISLPAPDVNGVLWKLGIISGGDLPETTDNLVLSTYLEDCLGDLRRLLS